MDYKVGDKVRIPSLFGFDMEEATIIEVWQDYAGPWYATCKTLDEGRRSYRFGMLDIFKRA